jgi:raffinose/stachyose/melibiose transport system substrate-binding protein
VSFPSWMRGACLGAIVFAAVLVTGCMGGSEESGSDASITAAAKERPEGELTLWGFTETADDSLWDVAEEFEKAYPGTKVVKSTYGPAEYDTKLLSAFSSSGEPDVFVSSAGEYFDKYVRTGKVATLDGLGEDGVINLGHYNARMVDAVKSPDGALHSLPYFSFALLTFANLDLLAEHGVEPPRTWDDLIGACRTLSAEGVVPISLGASGPDSWTLGNLFSDLTYQLAGPTGVTDASFGVDGASWEDEQLVQAAERLDEMVEAGCFPDALTGLSYTQMENIFLRGQAALIFIGTWFAETLGTSDTQFETAVLKFPALPGASSEGVVGGIDVYAATKRGLERNPALVTAFLNFAGKHADRAADNGGGISVSAKPDAPRGLIGDATKLVQEAPELGGVNDLELPAPLVPGYLDNLTALVTDRITPQEFGAAMQELVDSKKSQLPEQR